jgi:prepilin-type N-terminal cleavage/methylation domain-containing protein
MLFTRYSFKKSSISSKRAFTLVELSIVLLVLAFLISGLLVGREIVKRAKIQSLINDVESLKRSYKLFVDAYSFVPGDGTQAQSQNFAELSNLAAAMGSSSVATYSASINNGTAGIFGLKGDGVIQTGYESYYASRFLEAAKFTIAPKDLSSTPIFNISKSNASGDFAKNFSSLGNQNDIRYMFAGIGSGYISTVGNINVAFVGPVGISETAHWLDSNFIVIAGAAGIDVGIMTANDAIALKTKADNPATPYSGNVMAIGSSFKLGDGDFDCANTTLASGTSSAISSWVDKTSQFYSSVPGCRVAFLLI